MKKKYILVAKEFQSLLQSYTEDSVWQLSDKVLYDLCKDYPNNQKNMENFISNAKRVLK